MRRTTPTSRLDRKRAIEGLSVMFLLSVVVGCGGGSGPAADDASDAPDEPPIEAELNQVVEEIQTFVAEERGLEFLEPVEVEIADDEEFERRLLGRESWEEGVADLDADQLILEALGLLEPGRDLEDDLTELLRTTAFGFYDSEAEELVVRATELGPLAETVIAHELVHALEDQHFGLDRPEYGDRDDEAALGFAALVEGSATVIESRYFVSLSAEEQQEVMRQASDQISEPDVPPVMSELFQVPYVYGAELVQGLLQSGGQEALDEAFDDPPSTSEQVLDLNAYRNREPAVEVTSPEADGEVVWEGVLGQVMMELVLAEDVVANQPLASTTNWGGDRATTWRDGDGSCIRFVVAGDAPDDSDELHAAWSDWAEDDRVEVTATVEQDGPGGEVTVRSCSATS